MRCPVCKADNAQGPSCRRCKADLSLLWALESRRESLLASARRHLARGDWRRAAAEAASSARLRAGADAGRVVAAARLLGRDFPGALRAYLGLAEEAASDADARR
jgi:hypothetical protein